MNRRAPIAAVAVGAMVLAARSPAASDAPMVRELTVTMTDELRFEPGSVTVAAVRP